MALFDDIEIFAQVVETGNITRAAEKLCLSKSRVSECVMALESRLGVRLLDRTTRRVSPTEAGLIFYQRCRRALDEAEAGIAEVMARQDEPVGHLRIGAPEGFTDRYITPVLADFLHANPRMTAEIIEDVRLTGLVENRLDLSIRIVRDPDTSLIVRRIATSQVIICASPAHLDRHGVPQHPQDVASHRCIGFSPLFWAREWRFQCSEGEILVPVSPVLLCNSTASLRAAALADIGLVALPRWAVARELSEGALRSVLSGWALPESGIYAIYPSNRLVTTKVRRFVDHLVPILRRQLGPADITSSSGPRASL